MLTIKQITPEKIFANKRRLDVFLEEELSNLVDKDSWLTNWETLAQRFQLLKFKEMPAEENEKLQWDTAYIESVIEMTVQHINQYLNLSELHITVVPALPFSFFREQPQSLWSNAFTNGPSNIIIAIPPKPDIEFLQYLLAHESHHACPENPIYQLTMDTFTLEEWYKMEGAAEYFSLSLYPDKRWWRNNFSTEVEKKYWNECKNHLQSVDDHIKGPLCFGNQQKGIPIFAGYSFALKLVSNYATSKAVDKIDELFTVEPSEFIEHYAKTHN